MAKPVQIRAPKGALPVLQYCTPDQLQVDPKYQRELDADSFRLIDRIAANWDWGLCQPLVVARRADLSLFVVDGQHRLQAAKQRGDIAQLPCVIFQPAGPEDEAATFVALNQERRPLTPFALWNAALAAGDEKAGALAGLMSTFNMRFAGGADNKALKAGEFNSVNTVRKYHARHGDKRTRPVLAAIAGAFDGQPLLVGAVMFRAIGHVLLESGVLDVDRMVSVLIRRSQLDWLAEFRRKGAGLNIGTQLAANQVLGQAYVRAAQSTAPASAPAPAPVRGGRIDLNAAPSAMEQRASNWSGRDAAAR